MSHKHTQHHRIDPPEQTATQPERGTIIVDTSSLKTLMSPIPSQYRDPASETHHLDRYLDLLPFLANHGYQIKIPALSVLESCDIIPGCEYNRSHFFPNPAKDKEQASKRIKPLNIFMRRVEAGEFENISIEHSSHTVKAVELKNLIDTLNNLSFDKKHPNERQTQQSISAGRAEIIKFTKSCEAGHEEDEILEVAKQAKKPFVLSRNRRLLDQASDNHMGAVNLGGLLLALDNNGVFPYLGLQTQKVKELFNDAQTPVLTNDRSPVEALIDSDDPKQVNNYALSKSLAGISTQLKQEAEEAQTKQSVEEFGAGTSSQIDKFRDRERERQKLLAQRNGKSPAK